MDREEFSGLPLRLALGVIFDLLPGIANVEKPRAPLPPKFDDRMPKKKGEFCWMSEMTFDDLSWWHGKKQESAKSGSQWAEKDGKMAQKISHWLKWRAAFPTDIWTGERNHVKVTAAPPSRDPKLYSWDDVKRNDTASASADDGYGAAPSGGNEYSDADYGGSSDDSIPF